HLGAVDEPLTPAWSFGPEFQLVDSYFAPYVMESANLLSAVTPFELKDGFRKGYEEIKKAWEATMKKKIKKLPADKV
ncbi:MAG: hypothetical protein ABI822_03950, partial [Bryobacteraceae bacterium]